MPPRAGGGSREYRLDADAYVDYYLRVYLCQLACCGAPNLLCLPCVTANLRDYASAVGVRVTATHLVYARERIATCWRLACCDQGRVEKSIPLEKITDVILKEPAGGCPPQTLHTLEVQTASNAGAVGAELVLVGLREADARALREDLLRASRGAGGPRAARACAARDGRGAGVRAGRGGGRARPYQTARIATRARGGGAGAADLDPPAGRRVPRAPAGTRARGIFGDEVVGAPPRRRRRRPGRRRPPPRRAAGGRRRAAHDRVGDLRVHRLRSLLELPRARSCAT